MEAHMVRRKDPPQLASARIVRSDKTQFTASDRGLRPSCAVGWRTSLRSNRDAFRYRQRRKWRQRQREVSDDTKDSARFMRGCRARARRATTRSPARSRRYASASPPMACLLESDQSYVDEGYSGSILSRPALERLRDARCGRPYRAHLCPCSRSVARRYAHQVLLIDEFRHAGCRRRLPEPPDWRAPRRTISCSRCKASSRNTSGPKSWSAAGAGAGHAARSGSVSALTGAPFGDRYASRTQGGGGKRFEVVEDEVHIVRLVFAWIGLDRLSVREYAGVCIRWAVGPGGARHIGVLPRSAACWIIQLMWAGQPSDEPAFWHLASPPADPDT